MTQAQEKATLELWNWCGKMYVYYEKKQIMEEADWEKFFSLIEENAKKFDKLGLSQSYRIVTRTLVDMVEMKKGGRLDANPQQ